MHGLDWYDYGARWMDPALGRCHSMDPLCETDYDVSPYAYCLNSPINNIDLWGLKSYDPQTAQDNWDDFDTSKDDILLNEIVCTPNGNSQGGSSYLDNNISGRSSYLDCNISDILNTISNISFFTSNEATAAGSSCETYINWCTPSHTEKKMTKRVLKKLAPKQKPDRLYKKWRKGIRQSGKVLGRVAVGAAVVGNVTNAIAKGEWTMSNTINMGTAFLGFVPVVGPGLALTYLLVDTVYEEITDKSIAEQIEDSLK